MYVALPRMLHSLWSDLGMTELVLEETQPWAAFAWELPTSLKTLTIGILPTVLNPRLAGWSGSWMYKNNQKYKVHGEREREMHFSCSSNMDWLLPKAQTSRNEYWCWMISTEWQLCAIIFSWCHVPCLSFEEKTSMRTCAWKGCFGRNWRYWSWLKYISAALAGHRTIVVNWFGHDSSVSYQGLLETNNPSHFGRSAEYQHSLLNSASEAATWTNVCPIVFSRTRIPISQIFRWTCPLIWKVWPSKAGGFRKRRTSSSKLIKLPSSSHICEVSSIAILNKSIFQVAWVKVIFLSKMDEPSLFGMCFRWPEELDLWLAFQPEPGGQYSAKQPIVLDLWRPFRFFVDS